MLVHAEALVDGRRVTAKRVADERVAETRWHAGVEQTEAGLLLPRHLAVWSQQVLQGQNADNNRSYKSSTGTVQYKKAQLSLTNSKNLHGLRKSSGVVSCIARLPIDSVPMVSYYVLY